jgi:hypothetical protein
VRNRGIDAIRHDRYGTAGEAAIVGMPAREGRLSEKLRTVSERASAV